MFKIRVADLRSQVRICRYYYKSRSLLSISYLIKLISLIKPLQWDEENMCKATAAVRSKHISQRIQCSQIKSPRKTVLSNKRIKNWTISIASVDQETKLVDYACNRASLGIVFKKPIRALSFKYTKIHSIKIKNSKIGGREFLAKIHHWLLKKSDATTSIRNCWMKKLKNILMQCPMELEKL